MKGVKKYTLHIGKQYLNIILNKIIDKHESCSY